jgi:hypothetical protein
MCSTQSFFFARWVNLAEQNCCRKVIKNFFFGCMLPQGFLVYRMSFFIQNHWNIAIRLLDLKKHVLACTCGPSLIGEIASIWMETKVYLNAVSCVYGAANKVGQCGMVFARSDFALKINLHASPVPSREYNTDTYGEDVCCKQKPIGQQKKPFSCGLNGSNLIHL